ncbi:MAG: LPS export ABC transporter periplasmic protein LptC [Spirochaetales bacterium]|nr:LPS export ABC transporter periplasmic protein LptC [Spirochaetales bacterium]
MRNPRRCLFFILLTAVFWVMGCSLDYKEGEEGTELEESVPDLVFKNFVHTAVNGQKMVFQLEAERAQMYNRKKTTVLTKVRFVEYDDAGAVAIDGRAGSAVYHTDTENADLSGGVYGYSTADKVSFSAASLFWKKDDRLLQSKGNEVVRIEKDDGSYIEGRHFTIDAARKTLTFTAAVHGRYVYEKEETDNQ